MAPSDPTVTDRAMRQRDEALSGKENILSGSTVYLSGPMDFVASRQEEKEFGWRNRVGQFLSRYAVSIYDPWNKPPVAGLDHYGKEDEFSTSKRNDWTFEDSPDGDGGARRRQHDSRVLQHGIDQRPQSHAAAWQ